MELLAFEFLCILLVAALALVFLRINQTDSLAKRRLAAIEAAGDGIGIVDAMGNLTYMNRALMTLHRIEDNSEYIGKHWSHLYTEKGKAQIEAVVMPLLKRDGVWRGESNIVTRTGQIIPTELSLTLLPDGGFIGTARDISRRKEDETEKESLQRQIVQAQKMQMVGVLTGGLAHDFNNMLTIISGNLEILEDCLVSVPEVKGNVLAARRAVGRGAELTQRLLAFSRQQILAPKIININDIIPETVGMMKRTLGELIEIIVYLDAGLWRVKIDVGQIENAILNLCINARDAMPEGGSITIRTENALLEQSDLKRHPYIKPGQYVRVSVADTGGGIPPHIIDRVFDPFFTTKEVGTGSGLGLSMVYGFTKQSGGYVLLDSVEGSGTTVSLYFPRIFDEEIVQVHPDKAFSPARKCVNGDETILVVEDEKDVLDYNTKLFKSLGYKVWAAHNGAEAVLLLDKISDLHLLLTDVIMPGGVNGKELAEEARSIFPNVRVLFVSGYAPELQEEMEDGAMMAFLAKPYSRTEISHKVRELLDYASKAKVHE